MIFLQFTDSWPVECVFYEVRPLYLSIKALC